jgi:hypothetical protein
MMEEIKVSKILFHVSWLSSVYFLLLALNHYVIKSTFVLIGIVQEVVTIPLMLAQLLLFGASIFYWIKDNFSVKKYSFWTLIISLSNSLVIVST